MFNILVIPAKAGGSPATAPEKENSWIPAFAGMTNWVYSFTTFERAGALAAP
jgi:hypothetical protein